MGGEAAQIALARIDAMADQALALWPVPPGSTARRINVSENTTYLVEGGGETAVLRIHRPDHHSERAIACELAWSSALRDSGAVATPAYRTGHDGKAIQRVSGGWGGGELAARFAVMFDFAEGREPDPDDDLIGPFEALGALAARSHQHGMTWGRPEPFERLTWDLEGVFGNGAIWGNWRDGPAVTAAVRRVLERVEKTVSQRLTAFGQGPDRFGLIHADMRLANLLIDDNRTTLIDFDDCGFGWLLYDFAASISFMEDHGQVPALKAAWIEGYRRVRGLAAADAAEIDSFVMLRRLALLAWIGSHMEAPEPQRLAADFAQVSAELGDAYLSDFA